MGQYAVWVEFDVLPQHVADFRAAVLQNARSSVAIEPGCLRFDVLDAVPPGPRNWGQSAAATRQGIAATSRMTGRRGIQTVYSAPNHSIRSAVKPGTCRTLLTKASIDPAAVRANHGSRADLLSLGLHWGSAQSGLSGCNAQRGNWNASTPRRFPEKHAFADPPRSRRLHRVAISRNRFAAARCVQNARRPQSHDNFGDRLVSSIRVVHRRRNSGRTGYIRAALVA